MIKTKRGITMKKFERTGYVIYGFMTELLGLSGSELLVFALLYSFCRGTGRAFWGSRQYLAGRLGISLSSVDRGVRGLKAKGLIYSLVDEYRIDMTSLEKRCEREEEKRNREKAVENRLNRNLLTENNQFEDSSPSERSAEAVNLTPNNKEYIKGDTKENSLTVCLSGERGRKDFSEKDFGADSRCGLEEVLSSRGGYFSPEIPEEDIEPIELRYLGRYGGVEMSEEQYYHLCELIPAERVDLYLLKIEEYLTLGGRVSNPYLTVLGWIKRDFGAKR